MSQPTLRLIDVQIVPGLRLYGGAYRAGFTVAVLSDDAVSTFREGMPLHDILTILTGRGIDCAAYKAVTLADCEVSR